MSAKQTIDRVARVASALDAYWTEYGCSPTIRDLTASMGLHAYSNIHYALHTAAQQGRLCIVHSGPHQTPQYQPTWIANAINREIRWRAEHVEKAEQWQESTIP
jgi:hypothetical protein